MPDDVTVTESSSPVSGDSNSTPDSNTQSGDEGSSSAAPPQRQGADNPIPHYRHKEMLERAVQSERQRYEQELASLRKQYDGMQGYKQFAETQLESTMRALGLKEDPKPEFVDKKSFEQTLQKELQTLKQDWQLQQEESKLRSQLQAAKDKYPQMFKFKGFESGCLQDYVTEKGKSFPEIVEENVKAYQAQLDALKTEYAKAKADAAQTKVIKSGGGTGGGSSTPSKAPRSGQERVDYLRKKIAELKG